MSRKKVETVLTTLRMPPDLFEELNRHCEEECITKTKLVCKIIRMYLDIVRNTDVEYQMKKKLKGDDDNGS
jgi:predicted DNA-binding protein